MKKGFTLIELLVVIALMAILIGLAAPAFKGSGRGAKARTAIFQLNSHLNLARQMAITQRQRVYVLFPGDRVNYTDDTRDLAYSAYAIYSEDDGYIGEWRRLPPGVVFDDEYEPKPNPSNDPKLIYNIFLQTITNYLKTVDFPVSQEAGGTEEEMFAFTFRPDGRLDVAGFRRKSMFMTEGFLDSNPTPLPIFNTNATIYGLEIQPVTGQAKAREYTLQDRL